MYTLSIILNIHREGIWAARTIQNLRHVLTFSKKTQPNWETIEVIAVLDSSDNATKRVILENQDLFNKIDEVNYSDLADSRNHGALVAGGNFILFADGDDYVSNNTLVAIYKTLYCHYTQINIASADDLYRLAHNKHVVVVPALLIEFPCLFRVQYYSSNQNILLNNQFVHCYISKICIPRSVIIGHPARKNAFPYGYEDWDLDNRLMALGITFLLAQYTLYYRRNRGNAASLLAKQVQDQRLVRNSNVYSMNRTTLESSSTQPNEIKLLPEPWSRKIAKQSNVLKNIYHFYKRNRANITLIRNKLFIKERKFLLSYHEINLAVNPAIQMDFKYFHEQIIPQVKIFQQILIFMSNKEIIYFFQWLTSGAADRISIEYTKALKGKNVGTITSNRSGSNIDQIQLPHLDLPSMCNHWSELTEYDQMHILIKAIINSKVKLIHVVNSDLALKLIKHYSDIFKEYNIKVIVSPFFSDYD